MRTKTLTSNVEGAVQQRAAADKRRLYARFARFINAPLAAERGVLRTIRRGEHSVAGDATVGMMTLTFRLQTPRDALAKAEREFAALQAAVSAQDETRIADCVYNFSVSVYHVKDWLTEGSPPACSSAVVEAFVNATPSLLVCRDLCNASKHKRIRKYVPVAATVLTSAPTSFIVSTPQGPSLRRTLTAPFRVKVKMTDGKKVDVLSIGADAIASWNAFFTQRGL